MQSENNAPSGVIHGARAGQDNDSTDDYSGIPTGIYTDSSAEEGGGISLGAGVSEVGALAAHDSGESDGYSSSKAERLEEQIRHIHRQLGKLSMALGLEPKAVRLLDSRRVKQNEGSFDEAFQSVKKAFTSIYPTYNIDWNSNPAVTPRYMESSWHIGPWIEVRVLHKQIPI